MNAQQYLEEWERGEKVKLTENVATLTRAMNEIIELESAQSVQSYGFGDIARTALAKILEDEIIPDSEIVSPLPCPFCGAEAKITPAPHGPRIYCQHDSTCMLRAQVVYDFQLREWDRRANDRTLELEMNHIYAVATGEDQVCDSDTDALAHIASYILSKRVIRRANDQAHRLEADHEH